MQYAGKDGAVATDYPENPNGSFRWMFAGFAPDGSRKSAGDDASSGSGPFLYPDSRMRPYHQKERLKRLKEPIPVHGPGLALFKNAVNI